MYDWKYQTKNKHFVNKICSNKFWKHRKHKNILCHLTTFYIVHIILGGGDSLAPDQINLTYVWIKLVIFWLVCQKKS